MSRIMPCEHCGRAITLRPDDPPASRSFCSDACLDAWTASGAEGSDGWVRVEDLTAMQRAELEALLGHGQPC